MSIAGVAGGLAEEIRSQRGQARTCQGEGLEERGSHTATGFRSIYFTTKDLAEARQIGGLLVRERLVACINYFPIQSIYWWQGRIEESSEIAAIAKTTTDLVDRVIQRVKELHSYDVPCVVSWVIEKGNSDYFEWIRQSTESQETK